MPNKNSSPSKTRATVTRSLHQPKQSDGSNNSPPTGSANGRCTTRRCTTNGRCTRRLGSSRNGDCANERAGEEIRKRRGEARLLYPLAIAASRSVAPRVNFLRPSCWLPLFLSPLFRSPPAIVALRSKPLSTISWHHRHRVCPHASHAFEIARAF